MKLNKRADSLVPGDLLINCEGQDVRPKFVLSVEHEKHLPNVYVHCANGESREHWSCDAEVIVLTGLITPAQLHADKLLSYLRTTLEADMQGGRLTPDFAEEVNAFIDSIDPPKQPTNEELSAALVRLQNSYGTPDEAAARAAAAELTRRMK